MERTGATVDAGDVRHASQAFDEVVELGGPALRRGQGTEGELDFVLSSLSTRPAESEIGGTSFLKLVLNHGFCFHAKAWNNQTKKYLVTETDLIMAQLAVVVVLSLLALRCLGT